MVIKIAPLGELAGLDVAYFADPSVMADYQDAVGQVFAGFKLLAHDAKNLAAALVQFETKIAKLAPPGLKARDPNVSSPKPLSCRGEIRTARADMPANTQ